MLRTALSCLVVMGLLLASSADVDAQKKTPRGKRRAAAAPSD